MTTVYCFSNCDEFFIKKYGIKKAIDIICNFSEKNKNIPPIFDTYQLSYFLFMSRKSLFSLFNNADRHYVKISIPKKNGKMRELCVPDTELKAAQKIILNRILSQIPVSEYATAYSKGSVILDNAIPHINKKYLLKIDLKDFFSSIIYEQVYNSVFNKYYNKQLSTLLSTLCCYHNCLPQGAPTSPAISNIVMKFFDDTFGNWCKQKGFSYTRYCDDITVSGDTSLYAAYAKAKGMLENMGFELNENKTHFLSNGIRQSVTGLTVNKKLSVSREYKRKLRQDIYYALKFDTADISEYNSLLGKVTFVLQIEPDNVYFENMKSALKKAKNSL